MNLRFGEVAVIAKNDPRGGSCALPFASPRRAVPAPLSAALLAEENTLTSYDAVYASAAQRRGSVLATADAALLTSRLGQSSAAIATRLGLSEVL
jgi:hypothetical protein